MSDYFIDAAKAKALWRQGRSDPEIAEALGKSRVSICLWRKRNGLSPNATGGRKECAAMRDLTEDEFRRLVRLRRNSVAGAAKLIGVSPTTLATKARREGWL